MNVREYARIQTFPDEWKFAGSVSAQYKQIGNAVPVNLGFYIGKAARAILDKVYDSEQFELVEPISDQYQEVFIPKQLELVPA